MGNFWLWVVAILFTMPLRRLFADGLVSLCGTHTTVLAWTQLTLRVVLSLAILILSVALLVGATNNAFIYTRF